MKKILVILVALIGFCFNANADDSKTCKVKGDTTNGSVVALIQTYDRKTGEVTIDWSNDTGMNVNITVEVKVSIPDAGDTKKKVIFQAKANIEGSKTITGFPSTENPNATASIESLSGAKCN